MLRAQRNSGSVEKREHPNTETVVPVPVVGVVPVAARAARIPLIIVERAAPQHPKARVRLSPQYFRVKRKTLPDVNDTCQVGRQI
jgi:hypothetical protein